MLDFVSEYFAEVQNIAGKIDKEKIEEIVEVLSNTRQNNGRVFVLGIGGSASNAGHFVNDLRKLCHIDAYAPTDNVGELTARANDDGFNTIFTEYLKISKLNNKDVVFVLSVGGGSVIANVSTALVEAITYSLTKNAKVVGIVGKPDGYAAKFGDPVVVVPSPDLTYVTRVTPHSEAFQAVIWHCIVSHPGLQVKKTTW